MVEIYCTFMGDAAVTLVHRHCSWGSGSAWSLCVLRKVNIPENLMQDIAGKHYFHYLYNICSCQQILLETSGWVSSIGPADSYKCITDLHQLI